MQARTPKVQCDHSVINVPGEEARFHHYHSGVADNTGRRGVAIALSEAAQAALLAWVQIPPRLASARLKGTTVNLTANQSMPQRSTQLRRRSTHFMMAFRTQSAESPH